MADESTGVEGKIAQLHQKIEREARFTRSLVVICTAAILGVSLVPVKIMLTDLPTVITNDVMGKLEQIHDHWMILDRTMQNRHAGDAAATPTPPAGDAAASTSTDTAAK